MSSPLPPEPGLAARSVVAADMMPTRGSILAPVEHLGHGLASRPALWLRLRLLLVSLGLTPLADQIGSRQFVAFPANVNDVARVRDEVFAVLLPALGLADDVVRVELSFLPTDATGSPRLWVAPRHALPRDAWAFNPLQVVLAPNLDRWRLVDTLVPLAILAACAASVPRLVAPALRIAEAWSLGVVTVPDRPQHGAGVPLATQFSGVSFLVHRAGNAGRRHPILTYLPPHVVDESLLLPVRD